MIDPLYALRDVDVPVGARTRVRARIEEKLARDSLPKRRVAPYALVAGAAMAAVIALATWPHPSAPHAIDVPAGTQMDFAVATGHSVVHGPAQVGLDPQGLSLTSGRIDAQGKLRVRGPTCDVIVDGTAEVAVTDAKLTVRVFAGSVEIQPPVVSCERIDLVPPSQTPAARPTRDDVTAPSPTPAANPETITPPPAANPPAPPTASPTITASATPPAMTTTPAPRVTAPNPPPATTTPATTTPATTTPATTTPTPRLTASPKTSIVAAATPTPRAVTQPRASSDGSLPLAETRFESVSPRPPPPPPAIQTAPPAVTQATVPARSIASEELAAALAEYRTATSLESSDPDAAVRAWRAWRAHRSNTPLAHGADLRLLALLHGLHRDAEATELAREFLQRYPQSPRRADVERLLGSAH